MNAIVFFPSGRVRKKRFQKSAPPPLFSLSVRWHVTNHFCGIYFHKVNEMDGSWQEICAAAAAAVSIVLKNWKGGRG